MSLKKEYHRTALVGVGAQGSVRPRFRAKRERIERFSGFLPERQGLDCLMRNNWLDSGPDVFLWGQQPPLAGGYRGTSLIRTPPLLGPYSRTIPRVLWWS